MDADGGSGFKRGMLEEYSAGEQKVYTCSCDKLGVMRHRRVVDEGVCDHLVCFVIAGYQAEYES